MRLLNQGLLCSAAIWSPQVADQQRRNRKAGILPPIEDEMRAYPWWRPW